MQFLHLFHEVYPPGDDPKKNRKTYPYAVIIRDKEERAEFAEMLLNDGFERVTYECGISVMYVNFTLKRFGNAVKAVSSGTIDGELHEKDEFMENIYNRYKTDEAFRKQLSNNYALSAALRIVGAVKGILRNSNCSDRRYIQFEKGQIEEAISEIKDFMEEVN